MFKRILIFTVLTLSFMTFGLAVDAQLPPLIDREVFFDNPEIAGAQISPDGKFIAFRKPYKGTMNIWVKRADEPFEKARLTTNETKRPVAGSFWSRDSKYILFTKDIGGDENFNVYAVNPSEALKTAEEVPTARNLTEGKKVRAFIYDTPRKEPDVIYVGLNERDPAWHDLYKVKISTGEKTLIRQNTERLTGWLFDNAGKLRLAMRTPPNGDTEILRVDADGKFTKIYSCNVFETCAPMRFDKDNKRVYMQSNKGNVDLVGLVLFDPETGKEEFVESDPSKRVDLGFAVFSKVNDELLYTMYNEDRQRRYFRDKSLEADYKMLQSKFPNKQITIPSDTDDEMTLLINVSSDTEPGETYLFDRKTKKLTMQYRIREKLSREALAEVKAVRYKSSDGLEIPAYLTLPKGVTAKNLPTVIVPHGGPWGRDAWGYNSMGQFLANRGYAVLMPNFRASAGFGKKFLDAGNNQWGDKMQDDITWGVKYLVEQGIADPKRVGIMGGSYGGYATLAGVTYTPDLYAAAVAIVAPSNLLTLLESIPPYWEAGRVTFHKRMGDPNTPEGKAQLIRQSPLTHAAKIKTPLLVVQGANDPRVNKRESDQIVIALRDEADYKMLQSKFPNKQITIPSDTDDEMTLLINVSSDTEPGETYLFDRKTKKLTMQYRIREKLSREALAEVKAVRYKSSDGLEIPAYLTLPKGVTAKNLPTVIVPHGGPWGRDAWGYNSMGQFLANRGYAVLMPNFRASAGFGKKFLDAGNNQWGDKMQDDITWGVKYLVEQGIADPKRVGIMGGSYGGYATLAGVTYTPDLYAAAVAIVAPSNLLTLLESIPPYWEAGRVTFHKRMGDPNTPEGKAQLVRQSPLTHAAKIKTPLLVVQGANDPRVNKRESDQIVIALRDRNYPVEYIVAPDEGHGFARPVNNMSMFALGEKFLAKHLGGRYQASMTPEVATRLKEITVDPKTVTISMPKKADMNAAPSANIGGKWIMTANTGSETIPITLELKQAGAALSGSMASPVGGGNMTDGKVSGNMAMGTFKVEVQGQAMELKMEGTIEGDKMTGTLSGVGLPPITFTATKEK